jgi:hypothetical protein
VGHGAVPPHSSASLGHKWSWSTALESFLTQVSRQPLSVLGLNTQKKPLAVPGLRLLWIPDRVELELHLG